MPRSSRFSTRWKSQIVRENLLASRVPANVARPFELRPRDVAGRREQQARVWSKILPFVLFIWALTGAFYPAVDLCAGEKERGTLETLLSSPALRGEIVLGQAAHRDDVQRGDGAVESGQPRLHGPIHHLAIAADAGRPTWRPASICRRCRPRCGSWWLWCRCRPCSARFAWPAPPSPAARKEGQYYLMPLLLVTMPLMMLPMAPGAELNLGNSLIPVTGVVLLLKSAGAGQLRRSASLRACRSAS